MTVDEIRKYIIEDNIGDIPFEYITDIFADPAKYKLTFRELMRLVDRFTEMSKKIKDATPKSDDYQKRVNCELRRKHRELESRVSDLENKLSRMRLVFEEVDDEY